MRSSWNELKQAGVRAIHHIGTKVPNIVLGVKHPNTCIDIYIHIRYTILVQRTERKVSNMKHSVSHILAVVVAIIVILFSSYACSESANRPEFYPKLTVVFEIETIENVRIVYCIDRTRNIWTFYDEANEYEIGDIANLLMWAISDNPEMDEIIEVYWEGYTENINLFLD